MPTTLFLSFNAGMNTGPASVINLPECQNLVRCLWLRAQEPQLGSRERLADRTQLGAGRESYRRRQGASGAPGSHARLQPPRFLPLARGRLSFPHRWVLEQTRSKPAGSSAETGRVEQSPLIALLSSQGPRAPGAASCRRKGLFNTRADKYCISWAISGQVRFNSRVSQVPPLLADFARCCARKPGTSLLAGVCLCRSEGKRPV